MNELFIELARNQAKIDAAERMRALRAQPDQITVLDEFNSMTPEDYKRFYGVEIDEDEECPCAECEA